MGNNHELGEKLKQARQVKALTLRSLAQATGISASHLGRIERGERFPSGHMLKKLAGPLGLEETSLLTLAGMMSENPGPATTGRLDPYVAAVLAQEPVKIQRMAVSILSVIKTMTEAVRNNGAHMP
uniref:Putative DNA binding, helix-turn-helix domain containing protein n=1 Tax=viral metagenome TaxID=1070528 RepID=A0A6M3M232_9ZZZZ